MRLYIDSLTFGHSVNYLSMMASFDSQFLGTPQSWACCTPSPNPVLSFVTGSKWRAILVDPALTHASLVLG